MLLEGLQILYAVGHSSFGHSGIHLVLTVTVLDSYTRILLHYLQWTLHSGYFTWSVVVS